MNSTSTGFYRPRNGPGDFQGVRTDSFYNQKQNPFGQTVSTGFQFNRNQDLNQMYNQVQNNNMAKNLDPNLNIKEINDITTYVDHYRDPLHSETYSSTRMNSRIKSALPSLVSSKPSLPFLPGHSFTNPNKDQFNKHQVLHVDSKTCLEKRFDLPEHRSHLEKEIRDVEESLKAFSTMGFRSTTNTFFNPYKTNIREKMTVYNESYPRILPQWIKHDKNVLKFYGYFNEHSVETVCENYRSRKVNICYYLSDDTIHIGEEKQENSGLPQGYLIKRHRFEQFLDKDGKVTMDNKLQSKCKKKYVHWSDLNLASNLEVYGKSFRIYDCDDFTKNFYQSKGITLNPPEEYIPPKKIEDITNIQANDGSTPESRWKENMQNIADFKEYIEVKLKGGHPNKNLKQFLENDRKVLNFNILWFDEKYDKEEKPYIMNFYLADNTVEVREIKVNNSGKDPYPYLLRKSKLSKKPKFSYCPGLLKKENPEDYYTPKDLILGNYIHIYNRPCLIYDCDEFTKQWFLKNMGIKLEPIRMKKNPPQQVIHPIPPHIGYGSEEDSLLSVYYLTPMAKIRDMIKMFKQDKHIIRYYSKLISPLHSDPERNFIISVFCRDDTIQVYEEASKNSGRQSSKFMERQKVKNPYTNQYYTPKDFLKGKDIYLNSYIFRLIECDEYTKKFMIDNYDVFNDSDLSFVINRIRKGALSYPNLEEYSIVVLGSLDPEGQHWVTKDRITEAFKK